MQVSKFYYVVTWLKNKYVRIEFNNNTFVNNNTTQ